MWRICVRRPINPFIYMEVLSWQKRKRLKRNQQQKQRAKRKNERLTFHSESHQGSLMAFFMKSGKIIDRLHLETQEFYMTTDSFNLL
jgi:hypothetical protein